MSDDWDIRIELYTKIEKLASKYGLKNNIIVVESIIERELKTLRQKLIEDVSTKGLICSHYMTRDDFIAIINKRIGVEE